MQLRVIIDEWSMELVIPDGYRSAMADAFANMDRDMDQGWQFGQTWLHQPDQTQRCQIAASQLLTALERDNEELALLMGGYILARMPQLTQVTINTSGEPEQTRFT